MLYSVFNWDKGRYDVYEGSGEKLGQRPQPRKKVNDPNGNGRYLEALLPILPNDARKVDESDVVRGRVAIHHSSPAAGFGADDPSQSLLVTSPWLTLGLIAGGMWLTSKVLMRLARGL